MNHRILDSYLINNNISSLYLEKNSKLTLEGCYFDHLDGDYENLNSLTTINIDTQDLGLFTCHFNQIFIKPTLLSSNIKYSVVYTFVLVPLFANS